ncbi:MAG TPA: hypothetical protein VJI67_00495 [archaeon]|nr:hypothetical protein [archaeon]HLD81164.1 hypothetical protein [archaeon]
MTTGTEVIRLSQPATIIVVGQEGPFASPAPVVSNAAQHTLFACRNLKTLLALLGLVVALLFPETAMLVLKLLL